MAATAQTGGALTGCTANKLKSVVHQGSVEGLTQRMSEGLAQKGFLVSPYTRHYTLCKYPFNVVSNGRLTQKHSGLRSKFEVGWAGIRRAGDATRNDATRNDPCDSSPR